MAQYKFFKKEAIALLCMKSPPANTMNNSVRKELISGLDRAAKESARAVVIAGSGKMFSGGSDIKEIARGKYDTHPNLVHLNELLDNSQVPVVSAMHGYALGGGLEMALSCSHRLAAHGTKLGFPEVQLGLLSGSGGTQRLPRLIGVGPAVNLLTTGKLIDTAEALRMGLVDAALDCVDGSNDIDFQRFVDQAVAYAASVDTSAESLQRHRVSARPVSGAAEMDVVAWDKISKAVHKSARGLDAPGVILRCIREATTAGSFEQGRRFEEDHLHSLFRNRQSFALQYLYFAERKSKLMPPTDSVKGQPVEGVQALVEDVQRVGVVGGGTMGAGITMSLVNAGIPVVLLETNSDSAAAALERIRSTYMASSAFKSGRMSSEDLTELMTRVTTATDYAALSKVDMVIEAAFENMNTKKEIFKELDRVCKPDAILATNTSYLDVDEIGSATSRPHSVVGTHFFSPANIMKLLEIVRGENTSPDAIRACMQLSNRLSKVGVVAGNCHGFIGNRMLKAYMKEGVFLLEEGATPAQIDSVLKTKVGMAMGLFEMLDLAGNDVGYRQRIDSGLVDKETRPAGMKYSTLPDKLCEAGFLGQKKLRGWYSYDILNPRKGIQTPETISFLEEHRSLEGITAREISDAEILERCLFSLINEGFKILDEGIASKPEDIDLVYTFGYGFPRYRGGPMLWAEKEIQLANLYERLLHYSKQFPKQDYFVPSKLLESIVESGSSIREEMYFRQRK